MSSSSGVGHGRRGEGIENDQVFLKRGGLRNQLSARIQGQRGAVEDEAVVAAHLVGHEHRHAVAAGNGGQHLAADGALGVPEGRGGEVDVHGGMLAHQLFHGIDGVEAARPEVLVVPGVLADGDGQAHAVQFDHLLGAGGRKVALLVEDIVEGQQALVLLEQQLAADRAGRRHSRPACRARPSAGRATPASTAVDNAAGGGGQLIDGRAAAGQEAWLLKEVGRGIAADGQFGEDGKARAQRSGAAAGGNDLFPGFR